jgi:nucleotide-binding universal stress UspA family protein
MTAAPEQATVVVGVEGIVGSRAVIKLAAREASYRQAALVAVMTYGTNPALGAPAGRPLSSERTVDEERLVAALALHDAVVDALGDQAGQVEMRTVLGQAGRNLVEVARKVNAQLIVLASRTGASTLLGSVSQYVLRRAPCPILVVPAAGEAAGRAGFGGT